MSKLEIFRIDENGAGWVDFSNATSDEKMSVELGIITNQISVNCYFCHKQIPDGTGNACVNCKNKKGAIYLA